MMWCVRRPPWKLVRYHDPQNGDRAELFNIQLDAGEQHNGLSQPPEIGGGWTLCSTGGAALWSKQPGVRIPWAFAPHDNMI